MDNITKQAIVANGRSSCTKCPIGIKNCNMQYFNLCKFGFIKGYKSGRRYKYKNNKNNISLNKEEIKMLKDSCLSVIAILSYKDKEDCISDINNYKKLYDKLNKNHERK